MNSLNDKKTKITLSGVVGFFLAIAPILDPYILISIGSGFTLKINDVFMLLIGFFCIIKFEFSLSRINDLMYLTLGLLFVTFFANMYNSTSIINSLKNIIIWFIYALILSYIWELPARKSFFYWLEIFALIASIIVILQFIAGYIGVPMWDGNISFLNLSKYDGWAGYIDKNTGEIRPNGFFQESSYVGIYLSVALAKTFKENRIWRAIIFSFAMLLTTSLVAVISCGFVIIYSLIKAKRLNISFSMRRKILFFGIVAILLISYLINFNDALNDSFEYIIKRFTNFESDLAGIRMSSTKYRILGHIELFGKYDFLQKIIGVGVAQYASFFNVSSYSNVWVTVLLNSGFCGIFILVLFLSKFKKRTLKSESVFFWIMILIFCSDYQWFNWYFFYLMSACVLKNPNAEKDN